jgi:hypothetical protein
MLNGKKLINVVTFMQSKTMRELLSKASTIPIVIMHDIYIDWCRDNDITPLTKRSFTFYLNSYMLTQTEFDATNCRRYPNKLVKSKAFSLEYITSHPTATSTFQSLLKDKRRVAAYERTPND